MMYKIDIRLKFAIIAISFILAIVLTFAYGFWYAFIFWLIGLGFLASYFLLGTVQSAADFVQAGDMAGAEKRLGLTYFPNLLYVSNRAIYYILHGNIKMQRNQTKEAEADFQTALSLNLPTDTEKGMVLLQLAGIQAQRNNWNAAQNYFKQAKALKITEPMIKSQMDQFEMAFKQRGQAKVARQQMGGRRGQNMTQMGSKRRRPKMR